MSSRSLPERKEIQVSEQMNSYRPLQGRVAVVTGASRRSGIGYALARKLGMMGADLYLKGYAKRPAPGRST
jgi:3-oxoacyl-[acyl-carrier protein] reductase